MNRAIFSKCLLLAFFIMTANTMNAQQDQRKFRIAKIEIYPDYLGQYKTALAEHARSAMQAEPGVLALQAVYDKAHPTMVTVFEVYASEDAYQAHLKTPHFLKYKNGTLKMVKSLELVDVAPIAMEIKPSLSPQQNPFSPQSQPAQ